MKPKHFLLPVFTGLIASIWLFSQRHSITTLEKENADLEKRIAAYIAKNPDLSTGPTSRTKPAAAQTGKIDWKEAAAFFADISRGGGGDMRRMMRLQQRLLAMSSDEIFAALEEVSTLDQSRETKSLIENMLIGSLAQKDPQLALDRFIDRVAENNGAMSWTLTETFRRLAEKDPTQMTQWLDAQIEAGKFESKALDGRNDQRFQFEGALIHILLKSDRQTASARLTEIPADKRSQVITSIQFSPIDPESDPIAFAQLVREALPAAEQADALSRPLFAFQSEEDYSKASEYLNRIEATVPERAATVEKFAETRLSRLAYENKLTVTEVETMREWVHSQSPETVDQTTGKALANAIQHDSKKSFTETAELAMHYHNATGNDVILSTFLEGWQARQYKEESILLAAKISDFELREKILKKLR